MKRQVRLSSSSCPSCPFKRIRSVFTDASLVEHLFAITLPDFAQIGLLSSSMTPTLQKYKTTLQQQVNGRTKSLVNVVYPLESCAQIMQDDFSETITGQDDDFR